MFVSETGSSLSNTLEVPLKTSHLGSENLPSLLDFINGSEESFDSIASPLYQRKFDLRFTGVIDSEQQVWVQMFLDWRAFAMWRCLLLNSNSAARAAVPCRGHSCSANLADIITLFCNYTDNNNHTLNLLDKDLLYMRQHSLASLRHKDWGNKPSMFSGRVKSGKMYGHRSPVCYKSQSLTALPGI